MADGGAGSSALYEGWVRHRRDLPVPHRFGYRLFMLYLDLDELDQVFAGRWLWSTRGPALASFTRRDHLGPPEVPLAMAVRDLVEQRTGHRPKGPVRLLTHLRYFGYRFNPVSFYYCHAEDGATLQAIVAEINNTPWGEQHCYVLECPGERRAGADVFEFEKTFHVSPFMPMAMRYRWRFRAPGAQLLVHMENFEQDRKVFDATLVLARRPLTGRALARVLVVYPLMTLKVIAAIHWQALKLWLKGVPVHTHPAAIATTGPRAQS